MSQRHRVRYFAGCLTEAFFDRASDDALRLLRRLDVEVEVVRGASCCGQPAWNAGATGQAKSMARGASKHLFDSEETPVVVASGSCAAMIHHAFPELLEHAVPPVYELSQYLVDVLAIDSLGSGLEGVRVAYHHGCHALRALGVRDQPIRLLEHAGARVVPWSASDECCGFGGLFAVKLPHVSAAMADRKIDTMVEHEPDVLTSADGGCLLQLGGRLKARGREGRPAVRHLAGLLLRGSEVR